MRQRIPLLVGLILLLAGLALTAAAQDKPVDQLDVVSVQTLDLLAGPLNTAVYLAPDGERFAHWDGRNLCLYTIEGEQQWCVDIRAQQIGLDAETVHWSPDSRYLTFSGDFFLRFIDSDIWLLDADSGALTDLTDDGTTRVEIFGENWDKVDVLPRWTGDGKAIIFLRYRREKSENLPPDIYAIAPDGSGLKKLGSLRTTGVLAVWALAVSPDGFKLAFNHNPGEQFAWNGAWVSDLDGRNGTVVAAGQEPLDIPVALEFSADNRYLMFYTEYDSSKGSQDASDSRPEIVDLKSLDRLALDNEHFVIGAGWSPAGAAIAYSVFDRHNEAISGLYLASAPGQAGRRVQAGLFLPPTPHQRQMITWAANNTLLLTGGTDFDVVIIQLG